ncbi:hypothetical protein [Streptomyces sp. CS081A]|uniref:hypothetical protein n=1 Tax=Streptomyces sp. CS081A TaxID=2162709 RepID=UPI000D516438|nr:hypothetical protein [Streptomyces sp. CS081A]PVC73484.1 hypothetical protein DBP18_14150 [Streptomyces sp. CS081A]
MTRHTPVTPSRNALTCDVTGRTRPRHALYAKNIPNREEPPTDTCQTTYRATRADCTALTQTIQPGTRLYVHHNGQTREFEVTDDLRATPAGQTNGPRITLPHLLARCGAIHTQHPERTQT